MFKLNQLINLSRLLVLAALSYYIVACTSNPATNEEQTRLFNTISERLSLMEEVALFKTNNNIPIEDLKREALIIEQSSTNAGELGLDIETVSAFFTAQINAAKAIQYRYRADWLSSPVQRRSLDLVTEIRPEISRLGDEIVLILANIAGTEVGIRPRHRRQFIESLSIKHLNEADKHVLFNALLETKLK